MTKHHLDLAGMTMELGRLIRKQMQKGAKAPSPILLHALGFIEEHPGMRMSDFATLMNVSPSTATAMVDRLVASGMAKRATDARNRRNVCLQLTKKGRAVAAKHRSDKAKLLHAIFGTLPAKDRQQLLRIFNTLLERIHSSCPHERH